MTKSAASRLRQSSLAAIRSRLGWVIVLDGCRRAGSPVKSVMSSGNRAKMEGKELEKRALKVLQVQNE